MILGTRPEAIKLAPVVLALQAEQRCECRICSTAQHREMLDQILPVFGIKPDTDLDLMRPNQTLAELTARALSGLDGYLAQETPDLVLVQGDTTTVFCAALTAFYRHIPVGHVEAGLRTGNLNAPWPEEANRVLASRLTTLHFAPTESARQNLLREGAAADRIWVTGNTVIDALLFALEKVRKTPPPMPALPGFGEAPAPGAGANAARLVLITGHRRENFGKGFESICQAIAELARRFPEVHFVYPVHLNPNVREPVHRLLGPVDPGGGGGSQNNIHLIAPLPYLSFVALMDRASLILTDSGGIQEEAPSLGKPVLVMRETTERPEAVAAGLVRLVGTDPEKIVAEASRLLSERASDVPGLVGSHAASGGYRNPYGDGQAAGRIVAACCDYLASVRSHS